MSPYFRQFAAVLLCTAAAAMGCHPTQPFYFFEDGDKSHYLDVATEIEYPDVAGHSLDEVAGSHEPLTLDNSVPREFWDISLQEVIRTTLENSTVMRDLGGRVASSAPDTISRNILGGGQLKTVYDPALVESGPGGVIGSRLSGTGVEAALSEFDARLTTSMFWEKNDRLQNNDFPGFIQPVFDQELGRFTADISKTAATGGTFSFRNNTTYDGRSEPTSPARPLISDWATNFEASFTQPLLQGAGTQYNRIAGPFSFNAYSATFSNSFNGVLLSRIQTDLTLADFEGGVRDLVKGVEDAYWDLYFAYRNLDTRKVARDSALATWKRVKALEDAGAAGGEAEKEAQSRSQYYFFRSEVETALTEIYRAENRLRFSMGLAPSDGRLIRPSDEPTTAHVAFDWYDIHPESQCRRVEIRKQKWIVKQRELELIAAKNHLLPRLDAVGRYRWAGLGNDLLGTNQRGLDTDARGIPIDPQTAALLGSSAFDTLTSGDYQEWQLGLQLSVPLGYRRPLALVRHHQLLLARAREILSELELEVTHQLTGAVRDVNLFYKTAQSNFNRLVASQREVDAVEAAYEAATVTLDLLLDAQRRRADAETAYYQSLSSYNQAISLVHQQKGSLLEYNSVYLAEGPWPAKAYFDAVREARKRDASTYINYGFTRPGVMSRGPYLQHGGGSAAEAATGEPALIEPPLPADILPEEISAPQFEYELEAPPTPANDLPAPSEARKSKPSGKAAAPRTVRSRVKVRRSSTKPFNSRLSNSPPSSKKVVRSTASAGANATRSRSTPRDPGVTSSSNPQSTPKQPQAWVSRQSTSSDAAPLPRTPQARRSPSGGVRR